MEDFLQECDSVSDDKDRRSNCGYAGWGRGGLGGMVAYLAFRMLAWFLLGRKTSARGVGESVWCFLFQVYHSM